MINMYEIYEERVANGANALYKISTEKFEDRTDAVEKAIHICLNSNKKVKDIRLIEATDLEECVNLAIILNGVK